MSDNRLNDLEFKIAHQDVLLEELNQVICKQQETLDRLEVSLKALMKRFDEADVGELGPANQKPPHY